MKLSIKKILSNYLKEKHNAPRKSKKFGLSPSIIGDDCLRKIYYSYFKIEQAPKTILNILGLEGGNSLHNHFQKWLGDAKLAIDYIDPETKEVKVEFPISLPELKIRKGYIDRVLVWNNKIYLVEIKSVGKEKFMYCVKQPQKDHKVQGTIYIFAFENNLLDGKYDHIKALNKSMVVEGIIYLYVNRDNFNMKEFYVERNEKDFLKICNKIDNLSKYIDNKKLPPLTNGKICKYCPYLDWCKNNKNIK